MGKKKVQINTEPLVPTTVGKINTHKFGWIFVLFIFAMFFGIVYYLPELSKIYDNGNINLEPIMNILADMNIIPKNNNANITVDKELLTFGTNTTYQLDNIVFENIMYSNANNESKVTFDILNNSDDDINIKNKNIFFEIYSNDTLINGYQVDAIVSANGKESIEYITNNIVNKFKIYIKEDIVSQNDMLECALNEEILTYYFDDNGLSSFIDTNIYYNNEDDYYVNLEKYNNMKEKYQDSDYLIITVEETEDKFSYNLKMDYTKKELVFSNEYYFEKGKTYNDIKTYMEDKSFTCK